MKAVVATFNQEKALVGAFSVIVHHRRLIVYSTTITATLTQNPCPAPELETGNVPRLQRQWRGRQCQCYGNTETCFGKWEFACAEHAVQTSGASSYICSWHLALTDTSDPPPSFTLSGSEPRLIVTTLSSLDPASGQQLPLLNISRRSFMVLVNLLKHQLIKINITYHCLLLLKILCLKYLMISQVVTAKCLRSCSL